MRVYFFIIRHETFKHNPLTQSNLTHVSKVGLLCTHVMGWAKLRLSHWVEKTLKPNPCTPPMVVYIIIFSS